MGLVREMRNPQIKPEHKAYLTIDGNVRIGSVIYGIGAEIADPDGWIWALTKAMDGTRTHGEIHSKVTQTHPHILENDVHQAITDLLMAGFVEDAGAPLPHEFSEREKVRYGRGVTLLRWMDLSPRASAWEAQLSLRRARVLLVGTGGTGGFAAQALVASGVGSLHCADPDVVELSNLNRQPLFREDDIGKPKVDAALATLRALNSDVEVTGERLEIRGPQDLMNLLLVNSSPDASGVDCESPYDLLVLTADRPPEIRRWANRVCLAANIPWIEGGYRGPLVTIGLHVPGRGPCWECHRAGDIERRDLRIGPGQDEEVASPRMPWNPVNAVTAGLSGSLLAQAALSLLTGVPPIEPGFRFGVNLMMLAEPVVERFDRRPDCPACGNHQLAEQS